MKLIALTLLATAAFAQADAAKGKQHWMTYSCYGCHGYAGEGGGPGPRLAKLKFNEKGFIGYVRNPPRPEAMPSYTEKVLTDAQPSDIFAFLQAQPAAKALKDVPLLQQMPKQQ
jgi:mono/diheme cytochrome c family protein